MSKELDNIISLLPWHYSGSLKQNSYETRLAGNRLGWKFNVPVVTGNLEITAITWKSVLKRVIVNFTLQLSLQSPLVLIYYNWL